MPSPEGTLIYEESQGFGQRSNFAMLLLVALLILTAVLAPLIVILYAPPEVRHEAQINGIIASLITLLGGVITFAFLFFMRVETQVRTRGLFVRLRPLPWRYIAPDGMVAHQAITYRPMRDYGVGYHRSLRKKWVCFNASGNRGVRIDLADGSHVIIGSQTPDRLARAISQIRCSDGALPKKRHEP